MKTLYSTLGLLLSSLLVLPALGRTFRGQDVSWAYLTNSTFLFDFDKMQDLVVFGDSYSDVHTNVKNMKYDSEIYGGKNWALKLIDIPDHKVWLWDFAHKGAVVDLQLVPRDEENTSFVTQYNSFVENLYEKNSIRGWSSRTTLFSIWFGTNDIIYMSRSPESSSNGTIDKIIDSKFQTMENLYQHGARHFLLIYVPTIEKAPLNRGNSLYFTYDDTTYYNTQVNNRAKEFSTTHPDCNVLVYDSFMEFNYIMDNKNAFGINNIVDSCVESGADDCGKDETHFWHNDLHPSHVVQEALGQDIYEFLDSKKVVRAVPSDVEGNAESGAFTFNLKSLFLWNAIFLLSLLFI
ncbi:hypothetical protein BCR32DRAFT_216830 [Anaeromyces robustus]|uniref:SGNH hydrolase n=1 Tax=Anaeromyces robustus TaxID=1754192 RepID=A0A1Y1XIX2_9FUNG|nr:hypothetical protein BCR32DRAFT_216830 [Anaeromyces robustus]|eukprot:ORX85699.1 hypothetical protein BCR32DRAFT_216830 [Anaeromyces robustus]